MTTLSNQAPDDPAALLERRRALTGILEYAVVSLELTPDQRTIVETTYRECGAHLSKALGLAQDRGDIFPQGSMRLGTVIRPLRDITDVFDLDVVFRIALLCTGHEAPPLRNAIGGHLRTKYNGAVKPLPKGWRLDFSRENDYHLDVIPAMDSPQRGNVIAITDRTDWRDSNPRDFASWFEGHAAVFPRFEEELRFNEGRMIANAARIEPLPQHTAFKLPLQRIAQISKRHRDYYFNKKAKQSTLLTASIVVTTLLTKAYARWVQARSFSSGYDLLLTCVEDMPNQLSVFTGTDGQPRFALPNPSLPSENLVEKWKDKKHADAFFAWHKDYVSFLRQLPNAEAPQRRLLSEAIGEKPVTAAFAKQAEAFNSARRNRVLTVTSGTGLALGTTGTVSGHVIHDSK